MESIRVKNRDVYIIEVNDAGDTIEFDLTDIELPFALERSREEARAAAAWLKTQKILIEKQQDTRKNGDVMSSRERAYLDACREYFRRLRHAVDTFVGEGASDKIFGSKNYLEMFADFMEQMEPHIQKMRLTGDGIRDRLAQKYGDKEPDVL